jgi:hypothetical protein
MKSLLIAICFYLQLVNPAVANDGEKMNTKPVVEIIIFKVSDPVEGVEAAREIVENAKAYNQAITSSVIYQSASNPNTILQRIVWKSLAEAKAAFAASETFPGMAKMMELTTEHVFFDHFYQQ